MNTPKLQKFQADLEELIKFVHAAFEEAATEPSLLYKQEFSEVRDHLHTAQSLLAACLEKQGAQDKSIADAKAQSEAEAKKAEAENTNPTEAA